MKGFVRGVIGTSVFVACGLGGCVRAWGNVYISEFLADNENGIRDEDGTRQDWLELHNAGETAVNLDGWWLTDKVGNQTQWRIPAVSIPAKGAILIWASGKNRSNPALPLHTNFSLSKDGEYLGLYRPDPTNGLPLLVDAYAPKFPALPPDVSYGRAWVAQTATWIPYGSVIRYRVIRSSEGATVYSGTNYAEGQTGHGQSGGWNVAVTFNDAAWASAQMPVGWDNGGKYTFGTSPTGNIKPALYGTNTSVLVRLPFSVGDPSAVEGLTLRVSFEDGFVAFINGYEVLRANCSIDPLVWNAKSDTAYDKPNPPPAIETTFAVPRAMLASGDNLLAIQGLNASATSSDFFLDAELTAIERVVGTVPGYFAVPTPGEANGAATSGPLLFDAKPVDPDVPRPLGSVASPPLAVSVRVIKTKNH